MPADKTICRIEFGRLNKHKVDRISFSQVFGFNGLGLLHWVPCSPTESDSGVKHVTWIWDQPAWDQLPHEISLFDGQIMQCARFTPVYAAVARGYVLHLQYYAKLNALLVKRIALNVSLLKSSLL